MLFAHAADDRYFEDYIEGDVHVLGSVTADVDEMIAFSRRYDPQVFHVDPEGARHTSFGGLIASGWHTCAMVMRLVYEHYLTHVAHFGSPAVEELRFPRPVRPGDCLTVRATVLKAVPSRSKPDRGIVRSLVETLNQSGDVVMSSEFVNVIKRRGA